MVAQFAVFLLASFAGAAQTPAVTLRQCYDWATALSEDLKIRGEDVVQSQQRAKAALAGALPRLSWELADTYQDPNGVRRLQSHGFSGFIEKDQIESRFALRQPLFAGFKEYSALQGFHREEARDAFRLRSRANDLYERTASAYYEVIGLELDRDNTRSSYELAQNRVSDLRGFLRLGKARESELFTAQAHAAALKAGMRQTEARIVAAREDLSYLTGRDLSGAALIDELPDHPPVGSLEEAQNRARQRADVKAQRAEVSANAMRVRFEKGAFWPSLDLLGNYYTRRATFMREIGWDVALSLEVPLFQGGRVAANVRRAAAAYRQSILALEQLERQGLSLVNRLHGQLSAGLEELQSQEEAAGAAQKSYEALLEEYRLGLVTNLDVLQALDLLEARRSAHNAARIRIKQLFISLDVATERLP